MKLHRKDCLPGVHFFGEETVYTAILENLVENTVVFSPSGANIVVRIEVEDKQLVWK